MDKSERGKTYILGKGGKKKYASLGNQNEVKKKKQSGELPVEETTAGKLQEEVARNHCFYKLLPAAVWGTCLLLSRIGYLLPLTILPKSWTPFLPHPNPRSPYNWGSLPSTH